jgi:hypothetical protein
MKLEAKFKTFINNKALCIFWEVSLKILIEQRNILTKSQKTDKTHSNHSSARNLLTNVYFFSKTY